MNRVTKAVSEVVQAPLDFSALVLRNAFNFGSGGAYGVKTQSMKWWKGTGFGRPMNRTDYDFASEVGDPSTNSAVVAAVGWMARNFPEAPVRVARLPKSDGEQVIYLRPRATGPGRMLELLERPNKSYSGVLQWMATITDYKCTGNAYWLKVRNPMGRVELLWWLPSWMVEPKWDETRSDQFIGWYEYYVEGNTWVYRPEDIVHFRDGLDKHNPRKGLSPLASLLREIFTDDEAANMTASLMRNMGVPGVILSPANTSGPTGRFKDPEEMKETFMSKFSRDKRGEPFVSSVPVDLKYASWSPDQMNLRDLRKIPEERITAVLGVAAIVAGLGAGLDRSTFSNFGEARKAAYEESIIPAQRLMAAELETQLLDDFTTIEDYDVDFDWRQATAMQENAGEIWKRHQEAAMKGLLMRSEFLRAIGKPTTEQDDVYVVPSNFLFVKKGKTPQDSQPEPKLLAAGDNGRPKQPTQSNGSNGHKEVRVI